MGYNVGPVRPWTQTVADTIGSLFGYKTIGGYRKTDQFMNLHPAGRALDFMISSPQQGQQTADYLVANAAVLGTKTVIYNRQVWSASKPYWHPYTSTDNPHTDHVHWDGDAPASGAAGLQKLGTPAGGTGLMSAIPGVPSLNLGELFDRIRSTGYGLVGVVLGVALVGVGVTLAVRPAVKSLTKTIGGQGQ